MRIRNIMVGAWPSPEELKELADKGAEFKCRVESIAEDTEADWVSIAWEYLGHFTPGEALKRARELAVGDPVAAILCDHAPTVMANGKCFIPGCHNWVGRT